MVEMPSLIASLAKRAQAPLKDQDRGLRSLEYNPVLTMAVPRPFALLSSVSFPPPLLSHSLLLAVRLSVFAVLRKLTVTVSQEVQPVELLHARLAVTLQAVPFSGGSMETLWRLPFTALRTALYGRGRLGHADRPPKDLVGSAPGLVPAAPGPFMNHITRAVPAI